MSKKSLLSLLLTAALGAGILTGCQGTASPSPTPALSAGKDSVVIAMDTNSEPAAGFDPAFGWGAGEHVHEPLIQSTLTVTKPDLTIGYDLATGYSVSDDGLTWTVTIRDDARFTDGEALTAEDVAFTYNTVKESSSVNDFTMLDRAEAVDETTVAFHMNTPFSIWPYTMAVVGIVPEHAYDSATYGQNPIGSGRYVLKQWDRGQQIILEANPDYYGEAPTIRRFTILFLEEDAAFLAVQAGQVDLAYTSATYSDQSVAGYSLTAYRTVDNRGFNLPAVPAGTNAQGQAIGNDFTSDVLVRRAINIGIDREEMIENVLNGYGTPAYSVCDQLPWYNPASQVEYDPEAAAALLDEAGWTLGSDGIRERDGVKAELHLLYPAATRSARPCVPTSPSSSRSWASPPPSRGWAGTPPMTGPSPSPSSGAGAPTPPWSSTTSTTRRPTPALPGTPPTPTPPWTPTWTRPSSAPTWRPPTSSGRRPSGTAPPASPRTATPPGCGWSTWITSTGSGRASRWPSRRSTPTATAGPS